MSTKTAEQIKKEKYIEEYNKKHTGGAEESWLVFYGMNSIVQRALKSAMEAYHAQFSHKEEWVGWELIKILEKEKESFEKSGYTDVVHGIQLSINKAKELTTTPPPPEGKGRTAMGELIEWLDTDNQLDQYAVDKVKEKAASLITKEREQIIMAYNHDSHNNCGCGYCDFCRGVTSAKPISGEKYFEQTLNH